MPATDVRVTRLSHQIQTLEEWNMIQVNRWAALALASTIISNALSEDVLPEALPPMTWKPPAKRPEFSERLKGDEFQKRLKEALAKIDVAALSKSTLPDTGIIVEKVLPGSQATGLGIQPGDILIDLDGKPLTCPYDFASSRQERPQTLIWLHPPGERKTSRIEPGKVGVVYRDYLRADLQYLHGKARNVKWESYVLVASSLFREDTELAETCLHYAVAAGFDDPILDELGMWIADIDYRHGAAMDFSWRWLLTDPKANVPKNCFIRAARCSFQLHAALDLFAKYPEYSNAFRETKDDLSIIVEKLKQRPLQAQSPCIAAKEYVRDELTFRAECLTAVDNKPVIDYLAENYMMFLEASEGMKRTVTFGPACAGVDFTFSLSASPTGNRRPDLSKQAGIILLDQDNPQFKVKGKKIDGTLVDVGKADDEKLLGVLGVGICNGFDLMVLDGQVRENVSLCSPQNHFNAEKGACFRILVHKDRGEIFVNGKRAWYGPLSGCYKRLVPSFKIIGMETVFSGVRLFELVDPKDNSTPLVRDINKQYKGGLTRLLRSSQLGLSDQLPQLVALGADVNAKDSLQRSAIEWAAWQDSTKCVDYLASKGLKLDLFVAAGIGRTEKVAEFLKADPASAQQKHACGWTAFLAAAANNHEDAMKLILEYNPDLNACDPEGRTALSWAARMGWKKIAEVLIQHGAQVNLADKHNVTPLKYALAYGNKDLADFLKSKGATESGVVRPPPAPNEDF
ncbi:MAG: ankyrin repeat domain-containing protein [Planctomycetes bacterium]|nr:ankyrin repeat domain-containing protein [Planctomycetota bacterium]